MSGSANPGSPNSPWGQGPTWGQSNWNRWPSWYAVKPLWVAAMVLAFIFWWPVGLAVLFIGLWSKRMGFWGCGGYGYSGWQRGAPPNNWQRGPPPWAQQWKNFWAGDDRPAQSSGNHAFDEYRAETLRRLEEEQKEFAAFLDRLRFAKDKAEFDQFMAERRNRPPAPQSEQPPHGQS